ncbi:hypothetical protein SXCC_03814 [Gluconacetobacter sp. SXCC-1]|nr:hypothetical protein SXCC_03814 [Gluconacetobacter sp. SXCC-1]
MKLVVRYIEIHALLSLRHIQREMGRAYCYNNIEDDIFV